MASFVYIRGFNRVINVDDISNLHTFDPKKEGEEDKPPRVLIVLRSGEKAIHTSNPDDINDLREATGIKFKVGDYNA